MGQFNLLVPIALAAALQAAEPALAQDWPNRPITLIYPFAAGSGGDIVGRVFASRLSELLGQTVIFENAAGAGGMTGSSRVAKAAPDGYQVLLATTSTHAVNPTLYKKPLYNPATDFTPVALVAEQPAVLIARKDLPANDLQGLVAYAKTNQLHYGSAGVGSVVHLACALLNQAAGFEATHVPYRGGGAAMQDLIAGRIDYQCPAVSVALPQIEGKAVKALAILTKDRSPILPDLPSAHEQGLTDFAVDIWFAFFLPKATPAPIVQKLHAATIASMETPSVLERLKPQGATVVAPERRSPAYLHKFVESEVAKWAAVIRAANISME